MDEPLEQEEGMKRFQWILDGYGFLSCLVDFRSRTVGFLESWVQERQVVLML